VIKLNELYIKAKLHEWKVLHQSLIVVKNNDSGIYETKEGENHSIKYIDEKTDVPPSAVGKSLLGRLYSFKDFCLLSIDALDKFEDYQTNDFVKYDERIRIHKLVADIEEENVIFIDAYYLLGVSEMRRLEYKRSSIEDALVNHKTLCDIAKAIDIELNQWYPTLEIQLKLKNAHKILGIKKIPPATDITKYFNVEYKKKVINKIRVNGYYIVSKK
jgi:hypothetical protein